MIPRQADDFLQQLDPAVLEALYEQYRRDPESVEESWRYFFAGFDFAGSDSAPQQGKSGADGLRFERENRVIRLITAYRNRGHLFCQTNPVRTPRRFRPDLSLEQFGLGEQDLDQSFEAGRALGLGRATLAQILDHLQATYTSNVGIEYRYIRQPEVVSWLEKRIESCRSSRGFQPEEQHHLYELLTRTVLLEKLLHTRFVGQKRFSIEGVDSVVPALDAIFQQGAQLGLQEFVIGMPHRGRLNILANILQKPLRDIFAEFGDVEYEEKGFTTDAKYHLGYSTDHHTRDGKHVHLSLAPNPSHLEAVDPVVTGIVRAKLQRDHGGDTSRIAPILIHGDAAVAAQGVVYEVLQLSDLEGYGVGGTIHIILNNQVGFTTNYREGRSSTYCTDIAKVTLSPVFHVNGDDVEAVTWAIGVALEFRARFHRDVFIDILGYRKHGHNEGDEPRFTQPLLYKEIARHPNPLELYRAKLLEQGSLSKAQAQEIESNWRAHMEQELKIASEIRMIRERGYLGGVWRPFRPARREDFLRPSPETGVELSHLRDTAERAFKLPEEKPLLPKARRIISGRLQQVRQGEGLDWATAEWLCYATLLREGHPVRLSGQDSVRGTFSHRHSGLAMEDSEERWFPLCQLEEGQAPFQALNSPLSEYGVLGLEFGYSTVTPEGLTIWEAQFGDFANGAQIVFDQFLSCSEVKWHQHSGLVVLLPHGYEGQGHEHSSARLERWLQLCARENMQVAVPSTPASFFHLLRRQLKREFRRPLIVMSPKSLLRHPQCQSSLAELAEGTRFQEVLDDAQVDPARVTRVLLCSGKIFYELKERREKLEREDVALVRVEQLAPLPVFALRELEARYAQAEWCWVQEEPANMGAWTWMLRSWTQKQLRLISRPEAAATATGISARHRSEQEEILRCAFAPGQECDTNSDRRSSDHAK